MKRVLLPIIRKGRMAAPRWAEWAQGLRQRHGRTAAQSSPGMVLQRARALTAVRVYRPQTLLTLHLAPKLQFTAAISRILAPQVIAAETVVHRIAAGETAAQPPRVFRPAAAHAQPAVMRIGRDDLRAPHHYSTALTIVNRPVSVAVARPQAAGMSSITSRAVRHFQHVEAFVRLFRKAVRIIDQPERPAQRVLQQNARREEPRPPAAMTHRPAPAAASDAISVHAPEQPGREWPARPAPMAAPEINIEALTSQVMDQIDRRAIAWRERMGRF